MTAIALTTLVVAAMILLPIAPLSVLLVAVGVRAGVLSWELAR